MDPTTLIILTGILSYVLAISISKIKKSKDIKKKESLLSNIRYEYETLTNLVENHYDVKVCKRCYEKSMSLLQVSPSGRSVLYQCQHCDKKERVKSDSDTTCKKSVEIWEKLRMLLQEALDYDEKYFDNAEVNNNFSVKNDSPNNTQRNASRYIPEKVRHEVWRRDEGKCCICGSNEKLEFDHIIPFSKGGSNTTRNIQLLCETCNREKSAKI